MAQLLFDDQYLMRRYSAHIALLLLLVNSYSCKKEDGVIGGPYPVSNSELIGTWQMDYFATDVNVNKLLDSNEKQFLPYDHAFTLTFNTGGKGQSLYKSIKDTISIRSDVEWAIQNDTILKIVTVYNNKRDSSVVNLTNVTPSGFVLRTLDTGSKMEWIIYKRQ